MKDWVFGRRLMAEEGGAGGEGGGGAAGGAEGGTGGTEGGAGEGEEKPNALGEFAGVGEGDKPKGEGEGEEAKPKGEGEEAKPKGEGEEQKVEIDFTKPITDKEAEAYRSALVLDEQQFGKGFKFAEGYVKELPAMMKEAGLSPEKANRLANQFAALQQRQEAARIEAQKKSDEALRERIRVGNERFLETYDKPARETIGRAINHYFPKQKDGTLHPMAAALVYSEIGVDEGVLRLLHDAGMRLPKDAAPGAAAGAGTEGSKSISDAFMGS